MRKRIFMLIAILVVIALASSFALIGCKVSTSETTAAETAVAATTGAPAATTAAPAETTAAETTPPEPVTIKMLMNASAEATKAQWLDPLYEKFPELKYITIEFEGATIADLRNKVLTTEAAGGGYDIAWLLSDWFPELLAGNIVSPLNSYLEKDPIVGWPDEAYYKSLLTPVIKDGETYGIPAHSGNYELFYRKDLFENDKEKSDFKSKYGYDLMPPKTWQEYKDISDFFTRPEALYGTCFAGNDGQATPYDIIQVAHNFGGKYWDADGNPTFNSAEWVAALEFLGTMYKDNSPKGAAAIDMMGRADLFRNGKVAMYNDWSGFYGYFEAEGNAVFGKTGIAPTTINGAALSSSPDANSDALLATWFWCIPNNSKNKEAAYQIIKALQSPEMDKLWGLTPGAQSARISSLTDPEMTSKFPGYAILAKELESGGFYIPLHPAGQQILDTLKAAVQDYLAGKGTAQKVLDDANVKIKEAMDSFK